MEIQSKPLSGKIAVVIGAGRGIGRAIALSLASAGAFVVAAARTISELEAVTQEIQSRAGQAVAMTVDVISYPAVKAFADAIRRKFGRVDVLVNCAGVALIASLDATSEADWDLVLDTNLKGTYLCTHAMIDLLRASGAGQVVNIASKVGLTGHAMVSAYAAAKAGVIGFSRSLAQELSAENIRVFTVCPGPVDTPMRWAATPDLDPRFVIPAKTVAETVLFLVTMQGQATLGEVVVAAMAYDESMVSLEGSTGS